MTFPLIALLLAAFPLIELLVCGLSSGWALGLWPSLVGVFASLGSWVGLAGFAVQSYCVFLVLANFSRCFLFSFWFFVVRFGFFGCFTGWIFVFSLWRLVSIFICKFAVGIFMAGLFLTALAVNDFSIS